MKETIGRAGSYVKGKATQVSGSVKNVAMQAGGVVAGQVTGALRNLSVILIILGSIHFFFKIYLAEFTQLSFIFSLVLVVIAAYALSIRLEEREHKPMIVLPTLLFMVWYIVFRANADLNFLLIYITVSLIIIGIPAIFTKGTSIKAEGYGFIPVLFFFLDIGLIELLVTQFALPITSLMQNLILYMPWWALLGFMTLPQPESSSANLFVNLIRIGGIIYIIFVLIAPSIPTVGYDNSLIPGVEDFSEAQQNVRARLPQKESVFTSNLKCISEGRYSDLSLCVQQKQTESEIRYICTKQQGHEKDTEGYDDCVARELEFRQQGDGYIASCVDRDQEPQLTLELEKDIDFPTRPTFQGEPLVFAMSAKHTSLRDEAVEVSTSCEFISKKGRGIVIDGVISPPSFAINKGEEQTRVTCTSPQGTIMEGRMEVVFHLTAQNLRTPSRLDRYFVGDKVGDEKTEAIERIASTLRTTRTILESQESNSCGPDEFVQLAFGVGNSPAYPIIDSNRDVVASMKIDNLGDGRVSRVHNYGVFREGFNAPCLQGTGENLILPDERNKRQSVYIPSCTIQNYPSEYQTMGVPFKVVEFEGYVEYDYVVTERESIVVNYVQEASS